MTFFAFGLNHRTAPVGVREAFALTEGSLRELYRDLELSEGAEAIVVSTCNRTEAYLFGCVADVERLRAALAARAGSTWPAEHAFQVDDEEAVLHVLRVAAGVLSLVPGDAQILAQVKEAYRVAEEEGRVGTVLHRLMHTAFRTAKRVRTETALTDGAASVSSLAVQAARLHFEKTLGEPMGSRRVLLIGTGQMGLAALRALKSLGVRDVMLTNRSMERAELVAAEFGADLVAWEARHEAAASADLVLVASGAPEPILLADVLPDRAGAPALVVDVALPRNVEPAVARRAGYVLVDLDTLQRSRDETVAQRTAALPAAETICRENLHEFVGWMMHHEALRPALHALRDTFDAIRLEAIERYAGRFTEADREDLERLTSSILQKLLAVPIVRLKARGADSLDFARGVRFLAEAFSRPNCEDASARTPQDALPPPAACPLDLLHGDERAEPAQTDAPRNAGE
jgi:glutamyl-tRNA reductase